MGTEVRRQRSEVRSKIVCMLLAAFCLFAAIQPVVGAGKLDAIIKKTTVQSSADGAPELTEEASAAIDRGLKFLIQTQKANGSWDTNGEGGREIAITSLAMMAFMANAHFPGFGKYGAEMDKAKAFMMKYAKSRKDGYLGSSM